MGAIGIHMELIGFVVDRTKEGQPLNVVPMEMADENVRLDGTPREFLDQRFAEHPEPAAAIRDEQGSGVRTKFYARRVPPVPQVLGLRGGCRTPDSPKL